MARFAALLAALAAIVVAFVGLASARTDAAGDPALLSIGTFSAPTFVTAPPARRRGRIHTQSPRPGARRPRGARVHMTVSRGRRR